MFLDVLGMKKNDTSLSILFYVLRFAVAATRVSPMAMRISSGKNQLLKYTHTYRAYIVPVRCSLYVVGHKRKT